MTTLVMVQTADDVILGWDSLVTDGNEQTSMRVPKVIVNNGTIFAVAGRMRAIDLMATAPFPEWDGTDPRLWLIRHVDPVLRTALSHPPSFFDEEGAVSSVGLLAVVNGQAFEYDSALSPYQSSEGIYTIGSGGQYARGALYANRLAGRSIGVHNMALDEDDVMDALRAAAAIDTYTGGALCVTKASKYKEFYHE